MHLSHVCSMLRCTGVELELLTSVRKFLMVEDGIRGGFAFVKHRWYEKSEEVDGDDNKCSAFIIDANNLYASGTDSPTGWTRFLYGFFLTGRSQLQVVASVELSLGLGPEGARQDRLDGVGR